MRRLNYFQSLEARELVPSSRASCRVALVTCAPRVATRLRRPSDRRSRARVTWSDLPAEARPSVSCVLLPAPVPIWQSAAAESVASAMPHHGMPERISSASSEPLSHAERGSIAHMRSEGNAVSQDSSIRVMGAEASSSAPLHQPCCHHASARLGLRIAHMGCMGPPSLVGIL